MHIETHPEHAVPPPLRRQIQALQDEAWPPTDTDRDEDTDRNGDRGGDGMVHDPALLPSSLLLVDGGIVLAALDILRKPLEYAGNTFQAGGLSTVVTRAEFRGRGYGHRLVVAARAAMDSEGLDLGIFTCDRPLQHFYESAGWQHLPGTVLIGGTPEAPFPSDQPGFDKITLAAFFTPSAQQAAPTFHHARIPLHPGPIDKLW